MEKEISVLIPVYKVENYIDRCLYSVFNNTIINKAEVIIIDDGSPDSSMTIAEKIISEFPEIDVKIIRHNENKGIAEARNSGLKAACGKYIINVDSDDWIEPDYLEALYTKAEATNADITTCDFYIYENNKNRQIIENPEIENSIEYLKQMLLLKAWANVWFFFIKRSVLIDNALWWKPGVNLGEDHYIIQRAICYCHKISHVGKPLYHYDYRNVNSLSYNMTNDVSFYKRISLVTELNYSFFKEINLYPQIQFEADFSLIEPKVKILKLSSFTNYKKQVSFTINEWQILKDTNFYSAKLLLLIKQIAVKNYFMATLLMIPLTVKRALKNLKKLF